MAIPGQWLALEHKLKDVVVNATALGMKVNDEKTKLLVINPTLTKQAVPYDSAVPGKSLLCVGQMRLLGLVLDETLSWWPLVTDICSRAKNKTWALVRLREAGASVDILQVVLGAQSSSYSANLKRLSLDRLSDRRSDLILKFAISTFKNPKHRSWYTPSPHLNLLGKYL